MPSKAAASRTYMFHARLSPEEQRWLEELALDEGLSVSDFVRLLIRRLHRDKWPADHKPTKGART